MFRDNQSSLIIKISFNFHGGLVYLSYGNAFLKLEKQKAHSR